jgi:uncharacterized membrane protein
MSVVIGGLCGAAGLLYLCKLIQKNKWRCFTRPKVLLDVVLSAVIGLVALTKGFQMALMLFVVSAAFSAGVKVLF